MKDLVKDEVLLHNDLVWWICPICDWAISSEQRKYIKFDADCEGCGCRVLSQFIPVATLKDNLFPR